jgi:hypothetical protein
MSDTHYWKQRAKAAEVLHGELVDSARFLVWNDRKSRWACVFCGGESDNVWKDYHFDTCLIARARAHLAEVSHE